MEVGNDFPVPAAFATWHYSKFHIPLHVVHSPPPGRRWQKPERCRYRETLEDAYHGQPQERLPRRTERRTPRWVSSDECYPGLPSVSGRTCCCSCCCINARCGKSVALGGDGNFCSLASLVQTRAISIRMDRACSVVRLDANAKHSRPSLRYSAARFCTPSPPFPEERRK
jgi:hypothetical protein